MEMTRRHFIQMTMLMLAGMGFSHFDAPERKHTHMGIRIMMAGDFAPVSRRGNPVFEKTFMSFTAELAKQPPPPPITDSGLEFCNYMYQTYGVPAGLPQGAFTSIFMYQIFDNGIIS